MVLWPIKVFQVKFYYFESFSYIKSGLEWFGMIFFYKKKKTPHLELATFWFA